MPDVPPLPAEAGKDNTPGKRPVRTWLLRGAFAFFFVVAASLIAVEATEPLADPDACTACHEMSNAHDSWALSPHHDNPSGVKVTCVACHLPPREDHVAHLASKAFSGIKDAWVHSFGQYDAQAARSRVLETMPSQRCLHCHDNLLAMPPSQEVGIVHASAVERAEDRDHRCVACHDALHGAKVATETVEYEPADNSFCYVCHLNFKTETFVGVHKAAGVGCEACHGESLDHADDEDHIAAPDVMYTKAQVNASCVTDECHGEVSLKKAIGHRPFYAGAEPTRKHCTDCHGKHHVEKRQRRWDKTTRKLIWRDGYTVEGDAAPDPSEPRM
ncbi:MAG: NapC/NirT family cytochrome c [Phycisphaerae bacterium]|nr:NapC/NirT family cytochrome c [Phycisphaerae bacterium]